MRPNFERREKKERKKSDGRSARVVKWARRRRSKCIPACVCMWSRVSAKCVWVLNLFPAIVGLLLPLEVQPSVLVCIWTGEPSLCRSVERASERGSHDGVFVVVGCGCGIGGQGHHRRDEEEGVRRRRVGRVYQWSGSPRPRRSHSDLRLIRPGSLYSFCNCSELYIHT